MDIEGYKKKLRGVSSKEELKGVIEEIDRLYRDEKLAMVEEDWQDLERIARVEVMPKLMGAIN